MNDPHAHCVRHSRIPLRGTSLRLSCGLRPGVRSPPRGRASTSVHRKGRLRRRRRVLPVAHPRRSPSASARARQRATWPFGTMDRGSRWSFSSRPILPYLRVMAPAHTRSQCAFQFPYRSEQLRNERRGTSRHDRGRRPREPCRHRREGEGRCCMTRHSTFMLSRVPTRPTGTGTKFCGALVAPPVAPRRPRSCAAAP